MILSSRVLFRANRIQRFTLPVTDPGAVKLMEDMGWRFIQSLVYGNIHFCTNNIMFVWEDAELNNRPDVVDFFMLDTMTSGQFYVNGNIWVKDEKDFLIGVYSFKLNKHGFVWGNTFRSSLLQY